MRWSLRIGRILGIPIYLHFTFLIILPFFALVFGFSYSEFFGFKIGFNNLAIDDLGKALLGTLAAIVFFASILIHELCHSYVALRNHYKISGITLLIFGGVSEIEEQPGGAKGEAWMAFAGPGSSLVIGVIVSALYFLTRDLNGGVELQAAVLMFSLIGFYNILLGLFNLLPAFPMDGGRVLRALLARRLSFLKATKYAVDIGKVFAVGMGIFGLLTLNFILILIALFLFTGAEGRVPADQGDLAPDRHQGRGDHDPGGVHREPGRNGASASGADDEGEAHGISGHGGGQGHRNGDLPGCDDGTRR